MADRATASPGSETPLQVGEAPGLSAAPHLNGSAVAAFVLGLLGLGCLPVAGGVAALALGLSARGEIERSRGQQSGRGLALGGVALGAASLMLGVVGTAVLITLAARPSAAPSRPTVSPASGPLAVAPPRPTGRARPPGSAPTAHPRGPASRDESVIVAQVGTLVLIDLGAEARGLETELREQAALARDQRQTLVLWTSRAECAPCDGVAAALVEPRMQRALASVRLVRLDVREWAVELDRLGVPLETLPGFTLLGADHRPVDFLHGGEWDADVAENIAPVLGAFIRGTYRTRRNPWAGLHRSDETPI